jgi:ABC-type nickel/cobalt efflux system permease component RcnA
MRSFTELVVAEKAKLWQALSRSAVLLSLAIFATLAAFGGLVFALLGFYLSLETVLEPWAAGMIVGGAMILIALIALWVIARLIAKQGRTGALRPSSSSAFAAAAQPSGDNLPDTLRAGAREMLGAANIRTSDIMIGALVVGLVLGASPRLRQSLFRSITKE